MFYPSVNWMMVAFWLLQWTNEHPCTYVRFSQDYIPVNRVRARYHSASLEVANLFCKMAEPVYALTEKNERHTFLIFFSNLGIISLVHFCLYIQEMWNEIFLFSVCIYLITWEIEHIFWLFGFFFLLGWLFFLTDLCIFFLYHGY